MITKNSEWRANRRRMNPESYERDKLSTQKYLAKKRQDPEWVEAQRVRARNRSRIRMEDPVYRQRQQERNKLKHIKRMQDETQRTRVTDRQSEYRKTDRWKTLHAAQQAKRRRVKGGASSDDVPDIIIFQRDNWVCQSCGIDTKPYSQTSDDRRRHLRAATIDHIIPLARGGSDMSDNKQVKCRSCNSAKQDRLEEEWACRLGS